MFNSLKEFLAKKIILRRFKQGNSQPLSFNSFIRNAKQVLILPPGVNPDFEESLKIVNYLRGLGKEISLILNEDFIDKPELDNFNLISFSQEQISRLGMPSKNFLSLLQKKDYDVYIDLTLEHNQFVFAIGRAVNARFKVAFNKKNSSKFSNFLFTIKENNPMNSYENFLNSLRMF